MIPIYLARPSRYLFKQNSYCILDNHRFYVKNIRNEYWKCMSSFMFLIYFIFALRIGFSIVFTLFNFESYKINIHSKGISFAESILQTSVSKNTNELYLTINQEGKLFLFGEFISKDLLSEEIINWKRVLFDEESSFDYPLFKPSIIMIIDKNCPMSIVYEIINVINKHTEMRTKFLFCTKSKRKNG